jgi:hypothetical protein
MYGDDPDSIRKYQIRARLTHAEHGVYLGLQARLGYADDMLGHEIFVRGIEAMKERIKGLATDPRSRLALLAYEAEQRKQAMLTLARLAGDFENRMDEFEQLCVDNGFKVADVLALVEQTRSKRERTMEAKSRDKCRAFLKGLLSGRENGLEINQILTYAKAAGFESEQVVRRSLQDVAEQGWDGRVSFWSLPTAETLTKQPQNKAKVRVKQS